MASAKQVERIKEACAVITDQPVDTLVAKTEWGVFNFQASKDNFELIYGLAATLQSLPLELITQNEAEQIAVAVESARDQIGNVASFDPRQGNPNDQIQQLNRNVQSIADTLVGATKGWIPFLAYQRGDVQRNIDEMTRATTDIQKLLRDSLASATATKAEIDGIVKAARDAAADAGVAVFTQDFAAQAKKNESDAKTWLMWTAGFAAATVVAAGVSAFFGLPDNSSQNHLLQFMTSKLVVLLVLLTATVWCGRLYKASMHQAAANHHRANSLKTFQAFIKASTEEQTRDAVLLETTRSIFALTPSGYLEAAEPSVDTGTKVLEIFKGKKD